MNHLKNLNPIKQRELFNDLYSYIEYKLGPQEGFIHTPCIDTTHTNYFYHKIKEEDLDFYYNVLKEVINESN